MKYLLWLLKAATFFALFAFALNNQHEVQVNFFFGSQWRGPLVLVVLATLALGLVLGAAAMVPRWWRQQRRSKDGLLPTRPSAAHDDLSQTPSDQAQRDGPQTTHHGL